MEMIHVISLLVYKLRESVIKCMFDFQFYKIDIFSQ